MLYTATTRDFEVFIGGETSTSTPGKNDRGQADQLNECNLVWQWFSLILQSCFLYQLLLCKYVLQVNDISLKYLLKICLQYLLLNFIIEISFIFLLLLSTEKIYRSCVCIYLFFIKRKWVYDFLLFLNMIQKLEFIIMEA